MESTRAQISLLSVACVVGVLIVIKYSKKKESAPFPPGPGFFHAVKELLAMDASQSWLLFTKWNKQYGHFTYLNVGQPVLIIDSLPVARELLEKRSTKYSDRPSFPTLMLYGGEFNTGTLPYNDRWRQHRRFLQHGFRTEAASSWRPFQLQKAHALLLKVLKDPTQIEDHLATFTASTIMAVTYGYSTLPRDDPLLDLVSRTMAAFVPSTSMANLALFTMFPFLKHYPSWLPGLSFIRNAPVAQRLSRDLLNVPFEFVKKSLARGDGLAQPSLVSEFLSRVGQDGGAGVLEEEIVKEAGATGLIAGIETTYSTLLAFIVAMALHPKEQERAQAELDEVIGRGGLPTFEDRASLPYVDAILRETMRWFLSLPAGVPHCTSEDDVYNGYFIPKNTIVMVNMWAIAHDESLYDDPHTFNPSRFFTPEGKLNDDNVHYIFGFGRRICAGRHLAEASIWVAMACILAAFNIRKAKDEQGNDIDIIRKYRVGQVTRFAPFKCDIVPRFADLERLVRTEG